jgi:dTDP-4-amino-4,6-dideoxygalactose transaminase
VLGMVSRKFAHKIPFIVKLNHNELLTYPNRFDQVMFGSVQRAWELGAAGVGATIYYPVPLHRQAPLAAASLCLVPLDEAERAAREVLALPLYPELADEALAFVVETIRAFYVR